MRRREFIAGGVTALFPLAARAQQAAMPVIGFLHNQGSGGRTHLLDALRGGLAEGGYIEGRNLIIEYRWAENQHDRLRALAEDLVRRQVAAIAAAGAVTAHAAKAATSTIPIVFTMGSDPVRAGIVASLNRPGGNLTGVSFLSDVLGAKRLGLLREVMPKAATVAVLINPQGPDAESQLKDVPTAAQSIGQPIHIVTATSQGEIASAFATFAQLKVGALMVGGDTFFLSRHDEIIERAARHSIPTIYDLREYPAAGGLMSYGTSLADVYRQSGVYIARVLKGAKPADLPVLQPIKFELVINLKTAKALGLTVPPTLLARADEVIE